MDDMRINSVFSVLRVNLLSHIHFSDSFISSLSRCSSSGTLSEATHILVSSANRDSVVFLKNDGRSLIYIRNNSGPRQDLSRIPYLTKLNEECSPLRVQLCLRSVKYDMNHSNSIPTSPYFRSLLKRMSSQAQHGIGSLINMQKSAFLLLWNNYELYGCKILHIECFSTIESENLVRISKFFV